MPIITITQEAKSDAVVSIHPDHSVPIGTLINVAPTCGKLARIKDSVQRPVLAHYILVLREGVVVALNNSMLKAGRL
jgi:hypothetical protein